MNCITCQGPLSGRQTKFCSRKCKHINTNSRHQVYVKQQERGAKRRLQLIELHGGKCCRCGYSKNQAAIEFHHRDPKTKKFGLDLRKCSNSSWEALVSEAEKCILLCANCHAEEHHPEFNGSCRIRTGDPSIMSRALLPLS